jgi:DtxR family Mn-dependent transcriptional regulator
MEHYTLSEENYIKAIFHLSLDREQSVSTNALAEEMETTAASVSDMLKKLAKKSLIEYKKYQGVYMTEQGRRLALNVIRKHRLWEVFLVDKLGFQWDEVHEIAEQLEHIQSPLLVNRLDQFLGFPRFDPHGDPIPDEHGEIQDLPQVNLMDMEAGQKGIVMTVKDSSPVFLKYLDKIGIGIQSRIKVMERIEFDGSMEILLDERKTLFVSRDVASNLLLSLR